MSKSIISSAPIIVEVHRGTMVESRHRCHAVVSNAVGDVIHAWGDIEMAMFPRSAIKPMQALALIETGAAEHFRLNDERIALATASHSSSQAHVMAVEAWLDDLGLGDAHLECGAHLPYDERAAHSMIKRGEAPCRLHNNCSGKHTGFLATALHMGEETSGYLEIDHPVQKRLYDTLSVLADAELGDTARGIDGCGIPIYGMRLRALALAAARMADPSGLGDVRRNACERIIAAMAKHNFMVAGRGRFDTAAMTAGTGVAQRRGSSLFATKAGAEAVHTAILPELGLGIAIKCEDGAKRASDVVMTHLMGFLGVFDDEAISRLSDFFEMPVTNAVGDLVGRIAPENGWDRA